LEAIFQHGTIDFAKKLGIDYYLAIGSYPHEVPVISGMVDFAERDTVGYDWITPRLRVADDVGGVKKLRMFQVTYCASTRLGVQNLLPKDRLMDAVWSHSKISSEVCETTLSRCSNNAERTASSRSSFTKS
jgi:hypothetical protein